MATARDLITRSLRLIHVLDSGETPTADEANDSLEALNDLLDSMSIPGLFIYANRSDSLTWPSATESRTIGSGGNFAVTRPTKIDSAYVTVDSNDYRLQVLHNADAYEAIVDKGVQSTIPSMLYYEPLHPTGTLYLYPAPSAQLTLVVRSQEQLDQFATLDTTFAYPPGYKEFFVASLGQRLCPEFGVAFPPEAQDMLRRASRAVRRLNRKTPVCQVETGLIGGGSAFNIYTDA